MSIGFPRLPCTTDIPHSFAGTSQYRRVQLIVTHFIYWRGKNVAFPFLPASPASYNFSLPLSLSLSLFLPFLFIFPSFRRISFLSLPISHRIVPLSFIWFFCHSFFLSFSFLFPWFRTLACSYTRIFLPHSQLSSVLCSFAWILSGVREAESLEVFLPEWNDCAWIQ